MKKRTNIQCTELIPMRRCSCIKENINAILKINNAIIITYYVYLN